MSKKLFWIFGLIIGLGVTWIEPCAASPEPPSAFVLCYHTFLGRPKVFTDFSIAEFKAHVLSLQKAGFTFVQFKDVQTKKIKGKKNIVLVIDDGNISGYQAYNEVLKPLHIRPMFAIYPNIIGHVKYAMTWDQVKSVLADGCEISAHGFYHLYLTDAAFQKDPKGFRQEITASKKILESKLGTSVTTFVYPFGVVSDSAKQVLTESGYSFAFSLVQKPLSFPVSDPLNLPRYMVTRSQVKALLAGLIREK